MDKFLNSLTDQFLDSYTQCGGINHIDGLHLPSKEAVRDLMLNLLRLQFPGFYTRDAVYQGALPDLTQQLLKCLHQELLHVVTQSLELRPQPQTPPAKIVEEFLSDLVTLRCILQTDVEAAYDGDPAAQSMDEVMLAYPGVEAVAVQRMAHLLYRAKVPLLPRMMTEWAHSRTGIDIHPGAQIGTHFFVDHGTGVVVGETCVIGNHVRLYQGVTLGGRSVATRVKRDPAGVALGGKRHPTLEDEVTIYAAATILGGDTVIGARSVVGGNVWLTHSLPADSVAYFEGTQITIRSRLAQAGDFQI